MVKITERIAYENLEKICRMILNYKLDDTDVKFMRLNIKSAIDELDKIRRR